jgi:hypothetical protein
LDILRHPKRPIKHTKMNLEQKLKNKLEKAREDLKQNKAFPIMQYYLGYIRALEMALKEVKNEKL